MNGVKKNKLMFILNLILGCIPLFIIGFAFPKLTNPMREPVVFKDREFEFKYSTTQDGEIVYVYDLSLKLKFNEDISNLSLSFIFENTRKFQHIPKLIELGDFDKGEEDITYEIVLDDATYEIIDMKYKIDGQDEFEILRNGEIISTIILIAVMGFVAICIIVNAVNYAKRMTREE